MFCVLCTVALYLEKYFVPTQLYTNEFEAALLLIWGSYLCVNCLKGRLCLYRSSMHPCADSPIHAYWDMTDRVQSETCSCMASKLEPVAAS